MSFLTPDMSMATGALGRLGRVLYWLGAGLGLLAVGSGVAAYLIETPHDLQPLYVGAIIGAVVFLGGRGLCYVLAGE